MTKQARELKAALRQICPNEEFSVRTESKKFGKGREYGDAVCVCARLSNDEEIRLREILPFVKIDKGAIGLIWVIKN